MRRFEHTDGKGFTSQQHSTQRSLHRFDPQIGNKREFLFYSTMGCALSECKTTTPCGNFLP